MPHQAEVPRIAGSGSEAEAGPDVELVQQAFAGVAHGGSCPWARTARNRGKRVAACLPGGDAAGMIRTFFCLLACSPVLLLAQGPTPEWLDQQLPGLVEVYRGFHREPELSFA